jgi:hypothetical protein
MQFGVNSLISKLMEVNETLCMLTESTMGHCVERRYFRIRSYLKTSFPPTFIPAACPESPDVKGKCHGKGRLRQMVRATPASVGPGPVSPVPSLLEHIGTDIML